MMVFVFGVMAVNRIFGVHLRYLPPPGDGGLGLLDGKKLSLEVLAPELGGKVERVLGGLTGVQGGGEGPRHPLRPGVVKVRLDLLKVTNSFSLRLTDWIVASQ